MRQQRRDIGEDIDRIDRRAKRLRKQRDDCGGDVGFGGGGVLPEGEHPAAE